MLPDVGSMITESGFRIPRSSASSTIERAMRSLMLPPGLARSCLNHTSTRGSKRRLTRTWGVFPMVARMESYGMGRFLSGGRWIVGGIRAGCPAGSVR